MRSPSNTRGSRRCCGSRRKRPQGSDSQWVGNKAQKRSRMWPGREKGTHTHLHAADAVCPAFEANKHSTTAAANPANSAGARATHLTPCPEDRLPLRPQRSRDIMSNLLRLQRQHVGPLHHQQESQKQQQQSAQQRSQQRRERSPQQQSQQQHQSQQ